MINSHRRQRSGLVDFAVVSSPTEAAAIDQILLMIRNDLGLGFLPEAFASDALKKMFFESREEGETGKEDCG